MDLKDLLKEEKTLIEQLNLLDESERFCGNILWLNQALYDQSNKLLEARVNNPNFSTFNNTSYITKINAKNPLFIQEQSSDTVLMTLGIFNTTEFQGHLVIQFGTQDISKDHLYKIASNCAQHLIFHISKLVNDKEFEKLNTRLKHSRNELQNLKHQFHQISLENIQKNQELEDYSLKLEDRVAEKTKELQIALQRAEMANIAKSQFLATMSHEIRTPMNGVIAMTDLTLEDESDLDKRENLELVKTSAHNLLEIINDILDFSKIEAGKLSIEKVEYNLIKGLKSVHSSLAIKAFKKKLELLVDIDGDVPEIVLGDPGRVSQVLINIIGNAIKFTENGYIESKISCVSKVDNEALLQFSIRDTGIGIPATHLDSIFDSFTQADGSITRQFGGTGLGTTISRQLVELMGGKIWVESEHAQGSTFHFQLPFNIISDSTSSTKINFVHHKIVIACEHNQLRLLVKKYFKQWKVPKVISCKSLDRSIKSIRQATDAKKPFTLLIIDESIIRDNSKELSDLASVVEDTKLKCIYLSNRLDLNILEKVKTKLPEITILRKPLIPNDLLRLMQTKSADIIKTKSPQPRNKETVQQQSLRLNILVAEDNVVNQRIMQKLLNKLGHSMSIVDNGKSALDLIKTGINFDLILMDMMMPIMSGIETTIAIRHWESQKNKINSLHIIAMTANAAEEDRKQCLEAGMDDFISKPILKEALKQKLVEVSKIQLRSVWNSKSDRA